MNNVNKYIDITTGKQFSTGGKSYHIQHHNAKFQLNIYDDKQRKIERSL